VAFALIARWVAQEGEEEAVLAALTALAEPSRAEPGCLQWQAHRDLDDPRAFVLYERYADRAAYEAHLASPHFERHARGNALDRLEARERHMLDPLDL
jgi:quinol monooxygenase YgiN